MKEAVCQKCSGSGWKPHLDADGKRVWLPFMNDALPCECGALAKKYAMEKAAFIHSQQQQQTTPKP